MEVIVIIKRDRTIFATAPGNMFSISNRCDEERKGGERRRGGEEIPLRMNLQWRSF